MPPRPARAPFLALLIFAVRLASAATAPKLARPSRPLLDEKLGVATGVDAAVAIRQVNLNEWCVKLSVATFYLAVGVCSPMLPDRYVSLGSTASRYGQGVAAYSAAQLAGAVAMGMASDHVGHKLVLIVSSVGTALTVFASAFVRDASHLVAMRSLSGLFGGTVAVARGAVGTGVVEAERAGRIADLSAASSLGLTIGPLIVALLGGSGRVRLVFGTAAALNLLSALALSVLMWPVAPPALRGTAAPTQRRARQRLAARPAEARVQSKLPVQLAACAFICSFAFTAGFSTYPLLAKRRFGFGAQELGMLYAAVSATNALSLPTISRCAARWLGVHRTGRLAQVTLGCAISAVALAPSRTAQLLAFGCHVVAFQLADSSFASLASLASGREQQGRVQGVMQAAISAGRVCSPLICAALYSASFRIDPRGASGLLAGGNLPFVLVGTVAALCAVFVPQGTVSAAQIRAAGSVLPGGGRLSGWSASDANSGKTKRV